MICEGTKPFKKLVFFPTLKWLTALCFGCVSCGSIDWIASLSAPPLEKTSTTVTKGDDLSIAEQITSVIRQPAFIAGLGVAAWLVLMGFSGWLYCRHRRRKQLGHYTTSFAYTPAGEGGLTTYLPALGREKKGKSRRGYCHRTRDDLMNLVTDDSLCNGDIKEKKKDANHQILFSSNDRWQSS